MWRRVDWWIFTESPEEFHVSIFKYEKCLESFTLKTEAVRSSELTVFIYQSKWHDVSKDLDLYQRRSENLTPSYMKYI